MPLAAVAGVISMTIISHSYSKLGHFKTLA
jgi:hypothetical protein